MPIVPPPGSVTFVTRPQRSVCAGAHEIFRSRISAMNAALEALERYLNYLGPGGDGRAIYAELIDLFEQSAANGTQIREVVGEDPVAFIEAFIDNYPEGHWRAGERERFISTIERIEREQEEHR